MTQRYAPGMFPSSVFLVCANRSLALLVAAAITAYRQRVQRLAGKRAPFYYFSPCSISNILSSWAQCATRRRARRRARRDPRSGSSNETRRARVPPPLPPFARPPHRRYECLKYVSFPTQTLFKSSKVIPVMLVGRVVHGKRYEPLEYLEACGGGVGDEAEAPSPSQVRAVGVPRGVRHHARRRALHGDREARAERRRRGRQLRRRAHPRRLRLLRQLHEPVAGPRVLAGAAAPRARARVALSLSLSARARARRDLSRALRPSRSSAAATAPLALLSEYGSPTPTPPTPPTRPPARLPLARARSSRSISS